MTATTVTATTTTPARPVRAPRPRVRTPRVRATGAYRGGMRTPVSLRAAARAAARARREFVLRAVRRAAEEGMRQFLHVNSAPGTGPGADELHEAVREAAPGAKLVCCDRGPLVPAGAAPYGPAAGGEAYAGGGAYEDTLALVHADLGDPEGILDAPGLSDTIDLGHPVTLSVSSVPSGPGPYESVLTLLGALPAGSRLVLTHTTADFREAARFFDGLEAVGSGLVTLPGGGWAGVARKP